ncbi:MAG TPA: exodeoxyribonuclease VII large subunit, partial [Burkholderiales bacterium]|nr:exodeoxyribonuclease VII large subunit [Burkholderiales bacterium]
KLNTYKSKLDNAIRQLISKFSMQIKLYESKLDSKKINIIHYQTQIKNLDNRLKLSMLNSLNININKIDNLLRHLELVNPTNILSRGYAIIKDKNGHIVKHGSEVLHQERIEVILANDNISAIVDKVYNPSQQELI